MDDYSKHLAKEKKDRIVKRTSKRMMGINGEKLKEVAKAASENSVMLFKASGELNKNGFDNYACYFMETAIE